MDPAKSKIMLHYVQAGLNRSPNILFDRMRRLPLLAEKYDFVMLDQDRRPGEMGNFRLIRDLYSKIRREKPDIIHISGIVEGFHCMMAATLAGCRNRIIITHGFCGNLSKSSMIHPLKLWLFQRVFEPITLIFASVVQCNSESSLHQPVVRKFAAKKACKIYNVSPKVDIPFDKAQLRAKLSIAANDFVFISVGRIIRDKGFENIKAAILQTSGIRDLKFVIIGNGDYLDPLRMALSTQIEAGRVHLLGSLPNDEVLEWMKASDVFMLPSFYETFGVVYVEAAFSHLPSIAVDLKAVSEVIRNYETGILVPKDNTPALIDAMMKFYENPQLAIEMGNNAHRHVNDHFSDAIIEQDIVAMYERLLG